MLWLVAVLLPGSALAGVLTRSSGGHFGKIAETKVVVIVFVGWHLMLSDGCTVVSFAPAAEAEL